MFAGCINISSPSEVVETFASWHGAENLKGCYSLMSTEYRNSTDLESFRERIKQCEERFHYHYEFLEVKSEKIDGDFASVVIAYKRVEPIFGIRYIEHWFEDPKTKTVNLVKEEDGWRLTGLHCELKGK